MPPDICHLIQQNEELTKAVGSLRFENKLVAMKYNRLLDRFQTEREQFINNWLMNRSKTHTCMDGNKEAEEAIKAWDRFHVEA